MLFYVTYQLRFGMRPLRVCPGKVPEVLYQLSLYFLSQPIWKTHVNVMGNDKDQKDEADVGNNSAAQPKEGYSQYPTACFSNINEQKPSRRDSVKI